MIEHPEFGALFATLKREGDDPWLVRLFNVNGGWTTVLHMADSGFPANPHDYSHAEFKDEMGEALAAVEQCWDLANKADDEAEREMQNDIPERNYPGRF